MGRIVYQVQWTCPSTPDPVQVAWSIFWNDVESQSGTADVVWNGNDGEVTVTPTFMPYYSGINAGTNAYKLTATDQTNYRDASVTCTLVPV